MKIPKKTHFRNGKAIVYDKLVAKNDSTVFGLSKEEWKSKDIVDCIFDDSDEECNLIPNTVADLSIVSIKIIRKICYSNSHIVLKLFFSHIFVDNMMNVVWFSQNGH